MPQRETNRTYNLQQIFARGREREKRHKRQPAYQIVSERTRSPQSLAELTRATLPGFAAPGPRERHQPPLETHSKLT